MPFSEPPTSHNGRNGPAEERSRSSRESRRSEAPSSGANANFLRDSSSIQSMLRNTTETGDIGQFPIKPVHILYKSHRPSRDAGSPTLSRKHHGGAHYHQSFGDDQDLGQPRGIDASTKISSYQSQRQRSFRGPNRAIGPQLQDERSYSLMQNSMTSQAFSIRPSPASLRLHEGDLQGPRPRSPFAYPTRLKRPGYRPSSPALSDFNKSVAGSAHGLHRAASFRTSSPLSMHGRTRVPGAWKPEFSRSDPLLRHYPSPSAGGNHILRDALPPSPHMATPGPPPSLASGLLSSSSTSRQFEYGDWIREPSPSQPPVFYDYTEAFEEESHYNSRSVPGLPLAEQTIPEHPHSVYYELEGNAVVVHPSELQHHGSSTEIGLQEEPVGMAQRPLSIKVTRKALPQSCRDKTDDGVPASTVSAIATAEHNSLSDEQEKVRISETHHRCQDGFLGSPNNGNPGDQILTPRTNRLAPEISPYTIGTSRFSIDSDSLSSSSGGSMYSVQSSSRQDRHTPGADLTEPSDTVSPPQALLNVPSRQSGRSNLTARSYKNPDLQYQRGTSFDGRSEKSQRIEIYAPVPERPISSQSHRSRFSRILSIDVGLAEVDENTSDAHGTQYKGEHYGKETIPTTTAGEKISANPSAPFMREPLGSADAPVATTTKQSPVEESKQASIRGELPSKTAMRMLVEDDSDVPTSMEHNAAIRGSCKADIPQRRSAFMRKPAYSLDEVPAGPAASIHNDAKNAGRACVLTEGTTSDIQGPEIPCNMKKLPPLPRDSVLVSIPPPFDPNPPTLSFEFTALRANEDEDEPPIVVQPMTAHKMESSETHDIEEQSPIPKFKIKVRSDRESTASPPNSRPWNLDASYPWTNQPPKLEVTMPQPPNDPQKCANALPRFKLKVHRASGHRNSTYRDSTASTGTMKVTKQPAGPKTPLNPNINASNDLFGAGALGRKPRPSVQIGRNNSSQSPQLQTCFVESFEQPSATFVISPTITLVPPSPGLNLESRSFFSDDSSQMQNKGSLRKRLSQLRAMASRNTMSEDGKGLDRGLLNSAIGRSLKSGRTRKQSERTETTGEDISQFKYVRAKVVEKVKGWIQRGEELLRGWGGTTKHKGDPNPRASAQPFAGI